MLISLTSLSFFIWLGVFISGEDLWYLFLAYFHFHCIHTLMYETMFNSFILCPGPIPPFPTAGCVETICFTLYKTQGCFDSLWPTRILVVSLVFVQITLFPCAIFILFAQQGKWNKNGNLREEGWRKCFQFRVFWCIHVKISLKILEYIFEWS